MAIWSVSKERKTGARTVRATATWKRSMPRIDSVGPCCSATKSVAVITRFDRTADGGRIPSISASRLLARPTADPGSYPRLADGIRQFGDQMAADLRELWRRLVFSLLVSNYDDHLRNHGFLMHATGRWSLSPAYYLNPVPEIDRVQAPATPITENQDEPTVAGAVRVAPRSGLKTDEAKTILQEVVAAVACWREVRKAPAQSHHARCLRKRI